jgi:hypothetical protein
MWTNLTRAKLIQFWFAAVAVLLAAGIVLGAALTPGTAVLLVALSLVPPAIVLILWPSLQPPTASEVLRGDRRP